MTPCPKLLRRAYTGTIEICRSSSQRKPLACSRLFVLASVLASSRRRTKALRHRKLLSRVLRWVGVPRRSFDEHRPCRPARTLDWPSGHLIRATEIGEEVIDRGGVGVSLEVLEIHLRELAGGGEVGVVAHRTWRGRRRPPRRSSSSLTVSPPRTIWCPLCPSRALARMSRR